MFEIKYIESVHAERLAYHAWFFLVSAPFLIRTNRKNDRQTRRHSADHLQCMLHDRDRCRQDLVRPNDSSWLRVSEALRVEDLALNA